MWRIQSFFVVSTHHHRTVIENGIQFDWLTKGQLIRITESSIVAHSVDIGYLVDLNKASKVIHCIPSSLSLGLRVHILHTTEVIAF